MLGLSNSWISIQHLDFEAWHRTMLKGDTCVSTMPLANFQKDEIFHYSPDLDHFARTLVARILLFLSLVPRLFGSHMSYRRHRVLFTAPCDKSVICSKLQIVLCTALLVYSQCFAHSCPSCLHLSCPLF